MNIRPQTLSHEESEWVRKKAVKLREWIDRSDDSHCRFLDSLLQRLP